MLVENGSIRTFYSEKHMGWLRDQATGTETWFHSSDFPVDPAKIVCGAKVRYAVFEYVQKGQQRKKAVNIEFIVAPAKNPEVPFEPVPVREPEPATPPVPVARSTTRPPTPTAQRSLGFDTARTKKFVAAPEQACAILSDSTVVRIRGTKVTPPPADLLPDGGE